MIITEELAKKVVQKRPSDSHKGDFGRVLCIGGLGPYGGAIIMAAMATVYSGAGLVTVATDKDNITSLHSHLPEAMAFDVFDTELLEKQLLSSNVILIGPGLSETAAAEIICQFTFSIAKESQVIVCDASALNIIANHSEELSNCKASVIMTPHKKEWERISGISIKEQDDLSTINYLQQLNHDRIVLVYKQHHTKVYQSGEEIRQIMIGGPHQATGGTGDVLSGIISAFLSQFKGSSLLDVTSAAVYIHSAIADDLSEDYYVTLPTHVIRSIPKKLKQMSS